MSANVLLTTLCIALVLAGCTGREAATAVVSPSLDAAALTSVDLPRWGVGDFWTYVSADGSHVTRQVAREGVPCASGVCWEVLHLTDEVADVHYVDPATLGIAPFPVKPGDRWNARGAACSALDGRAVEDHVALALRCDEDAGSLLMFYAPKERNLVQLNVVGRGEEGNGEPTLRLVESGSRALATTRDLLPVPVLRAGDAWTYDYAEAGARGTLHREVTALEEPCGELRCYVVISTYRFDGGEEEAAELIEMTTLERVVDGIGVGDVRFPLRVGAEWTYEEPTDGVERACIVEPAFDVVCSSLEGGVTSSSWSLRGLVGVREDGEARLTLSS